MKKSMKKIICSLLVVVICLAGVLLGIFGSLNTVVENADETTQFTQSDLESGYVNFGSYPQSEVTDTATISALNAKAPSWDSWTSYAYYSGTGDFGTMVSGDWMRYTDVQYNGEKYRGVKFTQYRPHSTYSSSLAEDSNQYDNGYYTDTVYWFKFESLKWRVLDASTGLIMCETIIDSQPYSNTIYEECIWSDLDLYAYFNDSSYTRYANDYETSSIRAWLNDDFYNTSFTDIEQSTIATTILNNDEDTSTSNTASTNDKIFLLSYKDALNNNYGFSTDEDVKDTARQAQDSDYAKCQGLGVSTSGNSHWLLRSPGNGDDCCCRVFGDGSVYCYWCRVGNTSVGVRPVLKLILSTATASDPSSTSNSTSFKPTDLDLSSGYVYFGSYPQSEVRDYTTISALNSLAPDWSSWTSYGYYSGTGSFGTMEQGNWMRYADVTYNGEKYRGVKFTQYRPDYTYSSSSTRNSNQYDNGYYIDTVYWFKFESLEWRVLDPSTGLIMCEIIIDSQPYSNTRYCSVIDSEYTYFNDSYTHYASDYETSSIRAWLNNDFYNIAFTSAEQSTIATTTLNNDGYCTLVGRAGHEDFDGNDTNDKIFLLSYNEATNNRYGFNDTTRQTLSSDYAKCQGVKVKTSNSYLGEYGWLLRSSSDASGGCCWVNYSGKVCSSSNMVDNSSKGVRPALKLNMSSVIS